MKRLRYVLYLGVFLLQIQWAFAQQNYRVTTYNKEDGLQNELVKSVAIDTLGFVWLATDDGLIRYNGNTFEQYPDVLPSRYFKSLLLASDGRLYATGDHGFVEILSSAQ